MGDNRDYTVYADVGTFIVFSIGTSIIYLYVHRYIWVFYVASNLVSM